MDLEKLKSSIEDQIKELGRRVADCQDNKLKIEQISSNIDNIENMLLELRKIFDLSDKKHDSTVEFCKQNEKKSSNIYDIFTGKIEDCNKKIEKSFDCINENQVSSSKQMSRLDIIEKTLFPVIPRIETLEKVQNTSCLDISMILSHFISYDNSLSNLSKRISDLDCSIADIKSLISMLEKKLNSCVEQIHSNKNEISSFSKIFQSNIDGLEQKTKDLIKQSNESIKIPSVENLCSKDDVMKLSRKVELSCLDASNAFAKSQNNESQFQVLSKKIDSIQIEIKKIELNK